MSRSRSSGMSVLLSHLWSDHVVSVDASFLAETVGRLALRVRTLSHDRGSRRAACSIGRGCPATVASSQDAGAPSGSRRDGRRSSVDVERRPVDAFLGRWSQSAVTTSTTIQRRRRPFGDPTRARTAASTARGRRPLGEGPPGPPAHISQIGLTSTDPCARARDERRPPRWPRRCPGTRPRSTRPDAPWSRRRAIGGQYLAVADADGRGVTRQDAAALRPARIPRSAMVLVNAAYSGLHGPTVLLGHVGAGGVVHRRSSTGNAFWSSSFGCLSERRSSCARENRQNRSGPDRQIPTEIRTLPRTARRRRSNARDRARPRRSTPRPSPHDSELELEVGRGRRRAGGASPASQRPGGLRSPRPSW